MAVVSFDFDDTLAGKINTCYGGTALYPINKYIDLLKENHAIGNTCIILTARNPKEDNREIEFFLESHNLTHMIDKIVFTSHELKGSFAIEHNVRLHYDDDPKHLKSISDLNIAVVDSTL